MLEEPRTVLGDAATVLARLETVDNEGDIVLVEDLAMLKELFETLDGVAGVLDKNVEVNDCVEVLDENLARLEDVVATPGKAAEKLDGMGEALDVVVGAEATFDKVAAFEGGDDVLEEALAAPDEVEAELPKSMVLLVEAAGAFDEAEVVFVEDVLAPEDTLVLLKLDEALDPGGELEALKLEESGVTLLPNEVKDELKVGDCEIEVATGGLLVGRTDTDCVRTDSRVEIEDGLEKLDDEPLVERS
ncbi:hypothetical protein M409DRAFT_24669 [Zasmidium cellare ATCC 36951]|uniref:Uncharacterized protein n=1 Tax=Zasmidium cellare ATCC 36951 TaxID=1080233 RepID=A0A6A6CC58_ZASCE|nr:uncharacterized protein M409DRAFT_24669 [Zasmidium cellare ATCC 36951]KAF2164764.1 hypothetical protein M409DRAFT_24669 [Zasmidium cellare ATCC 36951]